MLANGQPCPSLNTYSHDVAIADDGSVDIYIGPQAPAGLEHSLVRTLPDIGRFPLLRLYGPLEPWISETWKPSDLQPID